MPEPVTESNVRADIITARRAACASSSVTGTASSAGYSCGSGSAILGSQALRKAQDLQCQSRSTIDLRETMLEGGVLLVHTAQGTADRDMAALVGASLLNLVDSVIRERESPPLHRRRGALVVVDEMQSLSGVGCESILSELGRYGASFILATQSRAKLEDLPRAMPGTLLANVGCLPSSRWQAATPAACCGSWAKTG